MRVLSFSVFPSPYRGIDLGTKARAHLLYTTYVTGTSAPGGQ